MNIWVDCPVCGLASLELTIDPGEPMVRYYPDGSGYPGHGPEVTDAEGACDCGNSALVNQDAYYDKLLELALSTGAD